MTTFYLVLVLVAADSQHRVSGAAQPSPEEIDAINTQLRQERARNEKHARAVLRARMIAPSHVKKGTPVSFVFEVVSTSNQVAEIWTGPSFCRRFVVQRLGSDGSWAEVWDSWSYEEKRGPGPIACPTYAEVHRITRVAPYKVAVT